MLKLCNNKPKKKMNQTKITTNKLMLRPVEVGALAESRLPPGGYGTSKMILPVSYYMGQHAYHQPIRAKATRWRNHGPDEQKGITTHTHIHSRPYSYSL